MRNSVQKLVALVLVAGMTVGRARGQGTAYDAIRALGRERGDACFGKLIELEGRRGMSQPRLWRLVMEDPTGAGGVREFEVEIGAGVRERVRGGAPGGPTVWLLIDLGRVNLNSDGAFQVTNDEAFRRRVGFDQVNYRLRVVDAERRPQWTLELIDREGRKVATSRLDAESGELISWAGVGEERGGTGDLLGRAQRSLESAGASISRGAGRVGETLERFFGGGGAAPEEAGGERR